MLTVLGLALAGAACVVEVEGLDVTEQEERVFSVTGVPDIDLSTFDGPIEVQGWDRPEVRVVIEKRGASAEALEQIEIEAEQSGNRIRVAATRVRQPRVTLSITTSWRGAKLIASVPHESNLVATTDDGRVTVDEVSGRMTLHTDDGGIRGAGLRGEVTANSGDGLVELDDFDGRVDARTDDGSLRVSGRLTGVRLLTDDGSIRVRAEPESGMETDWDIETDDGSVTLELPRGFSAELDARTDDGRVRVADGFDRGRPDDDDDDGEALRRTLGDGGRTLRVRSGDGSIRIRES